MLQLTACYRVASRDHNASSLRRGLQVIEKVFGKIVFPREEDINWFSNTKAQH